MEDSGSGCKELPEECWGMILSRLAIDDHHCRGLKSPSLVCKQFLSITDRLRHKLVVSNWVFYDNDEEVLRRALQRFRHLKEIELRSIRGKDVDIDAAIWKITSSGLDLRALELHSLPKPPSADSWRKMGSTMKNLKVLRCCYFQSRSIRDSDLVLIADAFPSLEELGVLYPQLLGGSVTDAGIEVISRKLLGLRKVDISGNYACSDRSLVALSSNCVRLQEICLDSHYAMTENGIGYLLCHSPNLVSLQVDNYRSSSDSSFAFVDSEFCARALRVLHLRACANEDRLLGSIAKAGIPLEELMIAHGETGLSLHGLSTFLCSCPSLKHLELHDIYILDDHSMGVLCPYLANVVSIKLIWCSNLTIATFFVLAKECPALSEITLHLVTQKLAAGFTTDLESNYRIRSVKLSSNCSMSVSDGLLKQIGAVCPNLHTLDVHECGGFTIDGIAEFLKCCSKIKLLKGRKFSQMECSLKDFIPPHITIEDRGQDWQ